MTIEQDTKKKQVKDVSMIRNPTGKGGFADHPESINFGGRPKNEQRFGYWLPFFKNLSAKAFVEYTKNRSEDDMYVAEIISYERVKRARKDLAEYKDLADRTEGKPLQREAVAHMGPDGKPLQILMGVDHVNRTGRVPGPEVIDATPVEDTDGGTKQIQDADMAQESTQDDNSDSKASIRSLV